MQTGARRLPARPGKSGIGRRMWAFRYMYILNLNPILRLVRMTRNILMDGTAPPLSEHMICLAYGVIAILIGAAVIRRCKDRVTTVL